jgi:hypothetical protein
MPSAWAAGGSSGGGGSSPFKFGKGSSTFVGFGGGTYTISDPKDQIKIENSFSATAGGDLFLFGPLFFSVAAWGKWMNGTMSYDYTDANLAHYTAQNVKVTTSSAGGDFGLQLRLVNSGHLHVFGEGGVFIESINYSYDFTEAKNVSATGFDTQKSQSSVSSMGTYAKAGVDLIAVNGWGLRVFGRAAKGATDKVQAAANQKLKYVIGEGFVGFVKQF